MTSRFSTKHLLSALNLTADLPDRPLELVVDSREARENSVFVAFDGENTDGHNYVTSALENGAVCAIVERDVDADPAKILRVDNTLSALQTIASYWRNQLDCTIVGITGSVGKTTTKELTHAVLTQSDLTAPSFKTAGNRNNEIGLPLELLKLSTKHKTAVLEMGMYVPGEIKQLAEIARPDIGVLTNIGTVHLERTGTLDALIGGKRELVEALPETGTAILNHDDPNVFPMRDHTQAQVFSYGLTPDADLWAGDIESSGFKGIAFTLNYQNDTYRIQTPMIGQHSVHTALRATAVGLTTGMAWEDIIKGLQSHKDELRLLQKEGPHNTTLIDDSYNASPQSTIAALNLLAELDGRKVAVLGDMLELGSDEQAGHERVGIRCAEVADRLIAVGPRGKIIGETARSVGLSNVIFADSAETAGSIVASHIQPRDIVLIKGSWGAKMRLIVQHLESLMPQAEVEA